MRCAGLQTDDVIIDMVESVCQIEEMPPEDHTADTLTVEVTDTTEPTPEKEGAEGTTTPTKKAEPPLKAR